MLRMMLILAVAVLAACGSDGDEPADIADARIVKVSGDQAAQVPEPGTQSALVLAAVVGTDGYTDEPLVARVEAEEASASLAGPSLALVPAGTLVHWQIEDGCGHLFGATTATDDSAYVVNRWAPGTVARTCEAVAGRLVGDSIVIDETWELEVLPGEPAMGGLYDDCTGMSTEVSDTLDLAFYIGDEGVMDAYGNPVPWTVQPLPTSALYTVRADGQAIIAAAEASGVDSMQVMVDGEVVRTAAVYVRHPDLESIIGYYITNDAGTCGPLT